MSAEEERKEMTIELADKPRLVQLQFPTEGLTIGNIEEQMRELVEYARSKGAPGDARIILERSVFFKRTDADPVHPSPAVPHDGMIAWLESPQRADVAAAP